MPWIHATTPAASFHSSVPLPARAPGLSTALLACGHCVLMHWLRQCVGASSDIPRLVEWLPACRRLARAARTRCVGGAIGERMLQQHVAVLRCRALHTHTADRLNHRIHIFDRHTVTRVRQRFRLAASLCVGAMVSRRWLPLP